jgi:hypothetical protein
MKNVLLNFGIWLRSETMKKFYLYEHVSKTVAFQSYGPFEF